MFRRFLPAIGLALTVALAAMSARPGLAQTNIDQGKPASELFANYCAVCHKSTRGLANGRSSLTLSLFLREHYAASGQQAAALAAYVIGAGGNAPKGQEAKGQERQEPRGQDAKGHEAKPRAASASPKAEPEKPARTGEPGPAAEPARDDAAPPSQGAAPVAAAPVAPSAKPSPSTAEVPELKPTTSAGVSADSQSNDNAAVPRDNIPD